MSLVVAPPYDVLTREEVTSLHARSAYNVARLTRPATYSAAAECWRTWRSAGLLIQDRPAMYLYRQTFVDPETGLAMPARTGLVCALSLESYDTHGVLPHENTIAAHRADRLELMRASHANFESIYGLYADDSGKAREILSQVASVAPILCRVNGLLGCDHCMQRIDDPDAIAGLQAAIAGRPMLIADGHHRYETALAYQREWPNESGSGAILTTLTAFEDEGLLVLPTHRLVRGVTAVRLASLIDRLKETGFDVAELAPGSERLAPGTMGFDMIVSGSAGYRVLLNDPDSVTRRISGDQSPEWKRLDVIVLHKLVIEDLLDIPLASLSGTEQVRYTRDQAEARDRVESGEFQISFLLSRPSIESIRAVSAAGDRMPQKSTYFYPKLLSGLVMRSLI
jgi:uncharacterized protein (DUF1015 family)